MRFSMGSRPGRFKLPGFGNYYSVGGYYWSVGGSEGTKRLKAMNDLMTARYGIANMFEAALAHSEGRGLTEEQKVEVAMETLGKPQRFRPMVRKLWRNKLVWGVKELAWDLDHYRKFGKWPVKDWEAELKKTLEAKRLAAADVQDQIS